LSDARFFILVLDDGAYFFCCEAHMQSWVSAHWNAVREQMEKPIPEDDYSSREGIGMNDEESEEDV
jgi:hypothetical protein